VSGQAVEKKIFCPGFEQFFDKDTSGNWKAKLIRVHIAAPDGVAGVFEYKPNQTSLTSGQSLTLLFTDHLGSVDLAINIPGGESLSFLAESTRQKFSYDPWGERRNETTWVGAHVLTPAELAAQHTDRGFTGHEMLDELGLINMNARIYDPQLGRFLSADSIVQNAGDLQSYNRYSYCGNSPLSRIDPSGHSWLSSAFKGIGNFVSKYWKTIVVIVVAIVVSVITYGAASGWAAAWVASAGFTGTTATVLAGAITGAIVGAASGFASGLVGGILAGGSFGSALSAGMTSAAWGALSGAVGGAIGSYFRGKVGVDVQLKQMAARGISGGLLSEAQGEKFCQGLYTGLINSGMDPTIQGARNQNWYGGLMMSAIVGGGASVVGGGKFENGAVTASCYYICENPPDVGEASPRNIAGGAALTAKIFACDIKAAVIGVYGTFCTTRRDIYNVVTLGNEWLPDKSNVVTHDGDTAGQPTEFLGAIGQLLFDAAIPDNGWNTGANWGTTQRGENGPFINALDYWSRDHDKWGKDRDWVRHNLSPAPQGVIPTGPIGMAIVYLGALPFWINNSQGYYPSKPRNE
jgi:RHS repeat-associated protein